MRTMSVIDRSRSGLLAEMPGQEKPAAAGRKAKFECSDVHVFYGAKEALKGVSLNIGEREVTALIGPSGCGKSTFIRCLNRMNDLIDGVRHEGDILLDGESILSRPAHRIAEVGIGRTFQNLAMFRTMSVERNVMVGAHCRSASGFFASARITTSASSGTSAWMNAGPFTAPITGTSISSRLRSRRFPSHQVISQLPPPTPMPTCSAGAFSACTMARSASPTAR